MLLSLLESLASAASVVTRLKRLWARRVQQESAGAVVFYRRNQKSRPLFLLIERGEPTNDWVFPKGKIKADEDIKAAALRETKEETGLEVEILTKLGSYTYTYYWDPANERVTKTVHYFLAKSSTDRAMPNRNSGDAEANTFRQIRFVDIEEAVHLVEHESERSILRTANQVILGA